MFTRLASIFVATTTTEASIPRKYPFCHGPSENALNGVKTYNLKWGAKYQRVSRSESCEPHPNKVADSNQGLNW